MTQISITIGQVIYGAVGSAGVMTIAVLLLKIFGKSLINHALDKSLEAAKSELAKELEYAKSELAILSARRLKLHDKEYVVFPELWAKLNKAKDSLDVAVAGWTTIPNFDSMDKNQIASWIASSDLSEEERSSFKATNNKVDFYGNILQKRCFNDAEVNNTDFHGYFINNKIFLSPNIKAEFTKIDSALERCLKNRVAAETDFGQGSDRDYFSDALRELNGNIASSMVMIEALMQDKLFPDNGKQHFERKAN